MAKKDNSHLIKPNIEGKIKMKRSEEVRRILSLTTEELLKEAHGQLKLFQTLDEVYEFLADEMVNEFKKAAAGDHIVSFIMPVGPTQPYRIMAEKINYLNLSLKNVRFFFMDEYVDDEKDELIPMTHPLNKLIIFRTCLP